MVTICAERCSEIYGFSLLVKCQLCGWRLGAKTGMIYGVTNGEDDKKKKKKEERR